MKTTQKLIVAMLLGLALVGVSSAVDIGGVPVYGEVPYTVVLTGLVEGDQIDFGDGDVITIGSTGSTETTCSHTYESVGTFEITVGDNETKTTVLYVSVVPSTMESNDPITYTLQNGWSTFSTPLPLNTVNNQIGEIFGGIIGDGAVTTYSNGKWTVCTDTVVKPGDGYYVYYSGEPSVDIDLIPDYDSQQSFVTKEFTTEGFQLFGYVPEYDGKDFKDRTDLDGITYSEGFAYESIVSMHNTNEWVYIPASSPEHNGNVIFNNFEAYWIDVSGTGTVEVKYYT